MKAKWIISLVLALQLAPAAAQSSQKGVLLQQIAALRVYGEYLGKGYGIVKNGLNTIGDLKEGEMNLHSGYFASLGLVNTRLSGVVTVGKIIELQQKILSASNSINNSSVSDFLSGSEIAYCQRVRERLLEDCRKELDYLYTILTDQALVMEDAKRLEAIEDIYAAMQANYTFVKQFSNEVRLLIADKQCTQREVHQSRLLNNIN